MGDGPGIVSSPESSHPSHPPHPPHPPRPPNPSNPPKIACVGSRQTPRPILQWMEEMGAKIIRLGYRMASGNGLRADQAWAKGANEVDPRMVHLFLPWPKFEQEAIWDKNRVVIYSELPRKLQDHMEAIVRRVHPAPRNLVTSHYALHGRNIMVVKGALAVIGWQKPGHPGGTGMAYALARHFEIPVFDVTTDEQREAAEIFLIMNSPGRRKR